MPAIPGTRLIAVVLASVLFAVSDASGAEPATPKSVIVFARKTSTGRKYTVDGKPATDLLKAFYALEHTKGANQQVTIVVDPRLRVDEVLSIAGVAAKAQLENVHVFIAFFDGGRMSEMKLMPPVPLVTRR